MQRTKGITSRIALGSAVSLIKSPVPSGKRRYEDTTLQQNLSVFLDLLSQLKVMHKNCLVNGDIKPGNLLLFNEHGRLRCYVSDLGSVRVKDIQRAEGTPDYLPPNVHTLTTARRETDCYAAGVTLKQLVYGKKAKISPEEILGDLEKDDVIDDVIRGLCNPDEENRLTASQALEMLSTLELISLPTTPEEGLAPQATPSASPVASPTLHSRPRSSTAPQDRRAPEEGPS